MLRIRLITATTQNAHCVHATMLMLTLLTTVTHLVFTAAL